MTCPLPWAQPRGGLGRSAFRGKSPAPDSALLQRATPPRPSPSLSRKGGRQARLLRYLMVRPLPWAKPRGGLGRGAFRGKSSRAGFNAAAKNLPLPGPPLRFAKGRETSAVAEVPHDLPPPLGAAQGRVGEGSFSRKAFWRWVQCYCKELTPPRPSPSLREREGEKQFLQRLMTCPLPWAQPRGGLGRGAFRGEHFCAGFSAAAKSYPSPALPFAFAKVRGTSSYPSTP